MSKLKVKFILAFCISAIATTSFAVPKYISYETLFDSKPTSVEQGKLVSRQYALQLAKLLDRAKWDGQTIRSTLVLNVNDDVYFVAATLGNGRTVNLYMDLIDKASREGKLELINNRYLIFPDPKIAKFEVFNKSEFVALGLSARYYRATYPISHKLSGLTFYYQLKRFSHTNRTTSELELLNGTEVKLNFGDSYQAIVDNSLLASVSGVKVFGPINRILQVKEFSAVPYFLPETPDKDLKTFGVQLVFENEINYIPEDIAISIERGDDGSFVDFTVPNSVTTVEAKTNRNVDLEYISKIATINNTKEGFSTLRASFYNTNIDNLDLLRVSPRVFIHPDRKNVMLVFYHDPLQIIDFGSYNWSESQLRAQQKILSQSIKPLTPKLDDRYTTDYNSAVAKYNAALAISDWTRWIAAFKETAIDFNEVAKLASNNKEIDQALTNRDNSTDHVFNAILVRDIYPIIRVPNFSKDKTLDAKLDELTYFSRAHAAKESFIEEVKLLRAIDEKVYLVAENADISLRKTATDTARIKQIIADLKASLRKIKPVNREIISIKTNLSLILETTESKL